MYNNYGMKASDLIKCLLELIEKHGDQKVISGGSDYPESVTGVSYQNDNNDPYIPKGTFYL